MARGCLVLVGWLLLGLFTPTGCQAFPSGEIRLLQSDNPADWEQAVALILPNDQKTVPPLMVSALTRRLPALPPETQLRLIRGLRYALEPDRRVQAAFTHLAANADPKVRQEAQRALDRLKKAEESRRRTSSPASPPPWKGPLLAGLALLLVLAPLCLGVALFLWCFRLLQLHRLLRHLPLSRIRSLTPGLVMLRGEVQPSGKPLFHPQTGELCVYYVGAEERMQGLRFSLVDDSGRVAVDPAGLVMLSEDGLLVAGEEVRLIASAERVGEGTGAERWLIRKAQSPRTAFERLVHSLIGRLFGFFSGSGLSKMLFSDPRRCFWIWDDLEGKPFGNRREVALIVTVFAFAGVWIVLAALAAIAFLDRDLNLLWAWLY
ncbi:MAG TPA: hypothetical protein VIA07_09615 [Desulfuromonadales bacterium]